jgi:hypothetical protein
MESMQRKESGSCADLEIIDRYLCGSVSVEELKRDRMYIAMVEYGARDRRIGVQLKSPR